jgi:hypothetical protein
VQVVNYTILKTNEKRRRDFIPERRFLICQTYEIKTAIISSCISALPRAFWTIYGNFPGCRLLYHPAIFRVAFLYLARMFYNNRKFILSLNKEGC